MNYYIYHDPKDTRKQELKQNILSQLTTIVTEPHKADLMVVLGGDGTMIRAIQELKHYDTPFFGVNCGTLGFLLNNIQDYHQIPSSIERLEHITEPFLESIITKTSGEIEQVLAVNDILLNHDVRLYPSFTITNPEGNTTNIKGSGLIISSAIGATGYRAGFRGPLLPTGNNNIGLMGIGTGNFRLTSMKHTDPYTIDIHSRDRIDAHIDGMYQTIADIQQITYQPSSKTFTLLFQDVDFHKKRLELYSSKLERYL